MNNPATNRRNQFGRNRNPPFVLKTILPQSDFLRTPRFTAHLIIMVSLPLRPSNCMIRRAPCSSSSTSDSSSRSSRSRRMSRGSRPSKSLRRRLRFQRDISDDIPVADDSDTAIDRQVDGQGRGSLGCRKDSRGRGGEWVGSSSSVELFDGGEEEGGEAGGVREGGGGSRDEVVGALDVVGGVEGEFERR